MTNFGKFLTEFMEKKEYKLEYVAEKTNVSFSAIGHYRSGKRIPKDDFIEKFIEAFNFTEQEKKDIYSAILRDRTPIEMLKKLERLEKIINKKVDDTPVLKGNAQIISEVAEEITIPVYGDISAGNGRIIYGDIVDYYTLDKDTKNIDQLIAIRVAGDSMENRIPNGSQVLIRRGVEVESGNVGAFCIGEECYVKQLKIYGGTPVLKSFNSSYPEMEVKDTDEFITIGKVVECKIKF